MGTCYYGVCHDCKEYIDLDKFYGWNPGHRSIADIDKEDLAEWFSGSWVYRSMRLHYFIGLHNGHRIAVVDEHSWEGWADKHPDHIAVWKEIAPWPHQSETASDMIDFTDPKAGRLVIKTKFGDITLDVRRDGVNCFRFAGAETAANRIDTLLLPATKRAEG